KGTKHHAKAVAIAGGLGSFEPRKPHIPNIQDFEGKGVDYMIREPEDFRGKKVVLAGGGDSALDWSIELAGIADELTLIHRRREFRGALDSVEKVRDLRNQGKINLVTPAEIEELHGNGSLESVLIRKKDDTKEEFELKTNYFIPLLGLSPKLGPLEDWGLEIEKNSIKVNNSLDYQTNIPGVYAIGDINTYPGKLNLILCGFHEATMMCQSVYNRIYPNKR